MFRQSPVRAKGFSPLHNEDLLPLAIHYNVVGKGSAWLETQKNPGFPGFFLCAEGDLNPHPLARTSTSS